MALHCVIPVVSCRVVWVGAGGRQPALAEGGSDVFGEHIGPGPPGPGGR